MRRDHIDKKMIWKDAAEHQEIFVRDSIGRMLLKVPVFVISEHRSKSITLPVYGFTMRNGIKVIARDNFYGWMLTVMLPKDRPYANIIPTDLLSSGYSENTADCYFEGFRKEWVYEGYHPDDIKQRNFSFGIYSDYEFYTVMYMLSHLYENIEINVNETLTTEEIKRRIDEVYRDYEHLLTPKDPYGTDGPVLRLWEVWEKTYFETQNPDFYKANGLEYGDVMHVDDNAETFAEFIVKYPEIVKLFLEEYWMYSQEY